MIYLNHHQLNLMYYNNMKKTTYYRVFDGQIGSYFGTGYNLTSMEELIEDFKDYITGAITFDYDEDEEEYRESLNTWEDIADYLQCVELEESNQPFEEL